MNVISLVSEEIILIQYQSVMDIFAAANDTSVCTTCNATATDTLHCRAAQLVVYRPSG